jgi:Fe-S-cluster formation regulator IscX/YfhJ
MGENQKTISVSNLFVDIYKNFNVYDQIEKIKQLDDKEKYLLLILALDKHSDEDPVVIHNFQEFKEQVMEIYEIQDDKETENQYLKELIELTGDKYIDTDLIVDSLGEKLPEPLTKEEVRDAKINIINSEE